MRLPAEEELRRERAGFLDTIESLTDAEFERGRTLCAGWAPRDVLAHVTGTDRLGDYLAKGLWIDRTNAAQVRAGRTMSRAELTAAGRRWAARPSLFGRCAAAFLLGDLAVHHQDVLRGLGRVRRLPRAAERAVFQEGVLLSFEHNRRLLRHRVVPTTAGLPALGSGPEVRGTAEALGMWLGGRDVVAEELQFAPAEARFTEEQDRFGPPAVTI
ncbi:maleylpyruvate isomerase family mycothiol-dependent enzyme [Streptomyces violens]|uniref:maleylpyruvate isomerase family mycothiol-dependent enzyme n=1 Tax=Streptomyces violens TaxID=66377 RepID=UPI0007C7DB86|nr:maleylpyruvate isomerase family mycothiol-dependent enzyme [Streptomyces violens]